MKASGIINGVEILQKYYETDDFVSSDLTIWTKPNGVIFVWSIV